MFGTVSPAAGPTDDATVPIETVPISHLALDLGEPPAEGWAAHLVNRGDVEIVVDALGRSAVTYDVAKMLLAERAEAEAEKARKRKLMEAQAVADDQLRRSRIWTGLAADLGEHPATVMLAAAKAAQPRRRSVLEDSLSNSGTVYHPIQHAADES